RCHKKDFGICRRNVSGIRAQAEQCDHGKKLARKTKVGFHNQIGKTHALPGDSRCLAVPGIVVRLGLEFASFPLAPTLSPRRGRALAPPWKNSDVTVAVPVSLSSFWSHTPTKLCRSIKARANVSPSPRGEGGGEGER